MHNHRGIRTFNFFFLVKVWPPSLPFIGYKINQLNKTLFHWAERMRDIFNLTNLF